MAVGAAFDTCFTNLDPSYAEHQAQIIRARRSVRAYLPNPVPRDILDEAIALAQASPSNSNTQPWRLYITTGVQREKLGKALLAAATSATAPAIPPLPEAYSHYRSDVGKRLYGDGHGLARDDDEGRRKAVLRNFNFFDAPVAGVVCMDDSLEKWDALGVGMYLQTLMLALTARGVGTCAEVSIAGYPEICRQHLGISEDKKILCGIAIGWPDEESAKGRSINHFEIQRDDVEKSVKFFE